ncbi:MAG: type II toxin-antitoxin system RelE/ParE family toxin [Pirellulales bacterium]
MPVTKLIFFRDEQGNVPLLEWLDLLPKKARAKCIVKLQRLALLGHELRRPEADFLRDGIYELRARLGRTNYRILYFHHGRITAVVSHGIQKERMVPSSEIDLAIKRKRQFEQAPVKHTFEKEL